MLDLDLTLRTPGRVLMLERDHAQALIDRAFEDRRTQQSGNLLTRALGVLTGQQRPRADADDEPPRPDRSKLAMPQIGWAGTIEYGDGYAIVDSIAIIDICGVLTPTGHYDWWEDCWYGGYAQIASAITAARSDDRVHGLFLRVDSPGGMVDGCFDVADAIRTGNAKSGGKPVWVHSSGACSAAYALACGADRILAAAESDVGSIGVLILHVDSTAMLAEWGIKVEAIQSGARKTDGAGWKPLSDDARSHLQGVVDQVARRFVSVVVAGRGLKAEAISAMQAQWFLAQHDDPAQSGLALGLVDAIASEQAAFAALQQSLTIPSGGAPAGSGSQAATDAARASQTTETEMSLQEQIAALRSKAAKGDAAAIAELKKLGVALKADADGTDGDEDKEDDDDDKDKSDDDDDEEDDGEDEPKASATGANAGFKLLNAKEAKGRTDLANRLGAKVAKGKLTYGEAKELLVAAPKARPLADTMAGRDHNPGNDGGANTANAVAGLGAAVDRQIARAKAGSR